MQAHLSPVPAHWFLPCALISTYLSCPRVPKCSQYWNTTKERVPSLEYCLAVRSGPCPRWAFNLHGGHSLTYPSPCSPEIGALLHCHCYWCVCTSPGLAGPQTMYHRLAISISFFKPFNLCQDCRPGHLILFNIYYQLHFTDEETVAHREIWSFAQGYPISK